MYCKFWGGTSFLCSQVVVPQKKTWHHPFPSTYSSLQLGASHMKSLVSHCLLPAMSTSVPEQDEDLHRSDLQESEELRKSFLVPSLHLFGMSACCLLASKLRHPRWLTTYSKHLELLWCAPDNVGPGTWLKLHKDREKCSGQEENFRVQIALADSGGRKADQDQAASVGRKIILLLLQNSMGVS